MSIKDLPYALPPYNYEHFRKLSAYCEGEKEKIKSIIPPPLEYVSNVFEVCVNDFPKISGLKPYMGAQIAVPVKYKDIHGGTVAITYVSTEDALGAGREIWGYNKRLLDFAELSEAGDQVYGAAWRHGVKIISISCKLTPKKIEVPKLNPRLLLKVIPRATGVGEDVKKIISVPYVGFQPGQVATMKTGEATVSFEPSQDDPLYKLMPVKVLGGIFSTGSFVLPHGEEIADLLS